MMFDDLSLDEDMLKTVRKTLAKQVYNAVELSPKLFVAPDADATKYGYVNEQMQSVKPPKKPGLYVFFNRSNDRPIYVGESDHLKRQLDQEIRPSGLTEFKTRWLREWLRFENRRYTSDDMQTIARFMANHLYIKFLVLYFGRTELANDLAHDYKLRVGPKALDFASEFKDWKA